MKLIKILSLTLSIILFIFTVSCDIPDIFSINDLPDALESEASSEGMGSESPSETVSGDTGFEESIGESPYYFRTAEDLHTYVTTGSTNPEDYSDPSYYSSELYGYFFPPHSTIKEAYLPIADIFDLEETAFDRSTAVLFTYAYWKCDIRTFYYTFARNERKDCFSVTTRYTLVEENGNSSNTENNIVIYDDMSAKDEYDECIIQQNINGTIVKYKTMYGKIIRVYFYYGDHYINVKMNLYNYITKSEFEEAHDILMTAPEAAAFAPFFSEDQAVREEAFARFEANYAAIKNQSE